MKKSMIVAMAKNGVIGRNNKLPWYLPEDLKYFKRVTLGKPVIMGRLTYESIGRPLPGRMNIVVTRNKDWQADGVVAVSSLQEAFVRAEAQAVLDDVDELMIIGGAQLYNLAAPEVDRIYLTEVHAAVDGDAHFNAVDWALWREIAREDFAAVEPNPYDYSFVVYERA